MVTPKGMVWCKCFRPIVACFASLLRFMFDKKKQFQSLLKQISEILFGSWLAEESVVFHGDESISLESILHFVSKSSYFHDGIA